MLQIDFVALPAAHYLFLLCWQLAVDLRDYVNFVFGNVQKLRYHLEIGLGDLRWLVARTLVSNSESALANAQRWCGEAQTAEYHVGLEVVSEGHLWVRAGYSLPPGLPYCAVLAMHEPFLNRVIVDC